MNMSLQKVGGIAALIEAALYITGFALFLTVLDASGLETYVEKILFLVQNEVALFIANLLIYVLFGVVLVVLVIALHERLKAGANTLMTVATAFGLLWAGLVIASGMIGNIGNSAVIEVFSEDQAQAVSLWLAMMTVQEALGGGNELVGGLWLSLLSIAALKGASLPRAVNYLGVLIGCAGLLTVVPALAIMMDVFGLGQIFWFLWIGVVLLRDA